MESRDQWAEWLLHRRFGADRAQLDETLRFLEPVRDRVLDGAEINSDDTVLDLGTGDGLMAFGALERIGEPGSVIFSDVSQDLLHHSRELAMQLGMLEHCRFVEAPAEDLAPIEDSSVDAITARSVLIYVDDKQRAFQEIHRVLKPGGRMSIYEPVNRVSLPRFLDELTGGFDVGPVRDIAAKVQSVFDQAQPATTDSMLNFDERDLITWLEDAGFSKIEMDYEVRIGPVPGMKWDTYLHTAFNPRMPTLDEAMAEALTPDERQRLAEHLRPLVESGQRRFRLGIAYVRATK